MDNVRGLPRWYAIPIYGAKVDGLTDLLESKKGEKMGWVMQFSAQIIYISMKIGQTKAQESSLYKTQIFNKVIEKENVL